MSQPINIPQEVREPVDDPNLKISTCPACGGIVRCAVEKHMSRSSKTEFKNEVFKHNLQVKDMPLSEFKAKSPSWCECKS